MGHLTSEQRYTISVMLQNGAKQNEIAITIDKDKSVISRELHRNCDKRSDKYDYDLAERKTKKRLREKPKKIRFTQEIKSEVISLLSEKFSPEQIAGRLKLLGKACVSHETIYKYIWQDKKQKGTLHTNLRHRGRAYAKRGAAKGKRGLLKNRVDISERPAIVEEKTRFGDLEIDTVIGQNHKGALLTINDRASSLVWIKKLSSKEAEPLTNSTIEALMPFKDLLHTITSDNGKEFANHEIIAEKLNIQMYFAKPYHSWERGANENTNGLIRQYFKKGSSFESITDQDVAHVQEKLNNRPRKRLGFLTPNEFFFNNFVP